MNKERIVERLFGTACLLALMTSPLGAAPTEPARPAVNARPTLAEVVDQALRDNADLSSLLARWEALQERPAQADALPNPMFKFSVMDRTDGGDGFEDTAEKRYMLEQSFPGFGKRPLRQALARNEAESLRWELEILRQDTVRQAQETYYDLYGVQQVLALTRSEDPVLRQLAHIAETQYATGKRPQQDVLMAQAEQSMLKQRLLELEARENSLRANLNALLNRPPDTPLDAVEAPALTDITNRLRNLPAWSADRLPEVRAAGTGMARYELERELMRRESRPDYQVGVELRDMAADDDLLMFSIGVELPIRRAALQARVREAEKMTIAGQAARAAAERNSQRDAQDALFKLRTALQQWTLYTTELLPQAEARFQAGEAAYRTGQADFRDLLESQRFLLSVRSLTAEAEANLGLQAARFERAWGFPLSRSTRKD